MRVNDFALARGAKEPITIKQTAEKLWEPRFLAEIIAGRDPKVPPNVPKAAEGVTIAGFLDRYYENYVLAEGRTRSGNDPKPAEGGQSTRSPFPAGTRRMRRTGAFPSTLIDAWRRF